MRGFLAGGAGNDLIETWETEAIIAFNLGEGQDSVTFSQPTTISLGAPSVVTQMGLALDAQGNVRIDFGGTDALTLTNWGDEVTWSALRLQVIGEDAALFDLGQAIVQLRAAHAADPGVISQVVDLDTYVLSRSTAVAIGGDLAYQYAKFGTVSALSSEAMQFVLGAEAFARLAQPFTPINRPPMAALPLADQVAMQDAAFSLILPSETFSDPDVSDSLNYSAMLADDSALPAWLTFNAATRTFTGTPINADVGTVGVKVTATDGAMASVSDVFDIAVTNINDAPTLANAIADQSATEDSAFSFVVPVNSFSDVDVGDTLVYSASLADGTALLSWLNFNAGTRTFSGTPVNADVGTVSVKVTATDTASAVVSDVFDILVINTNDAPVVANAIADQGALEDAPFSFQIPADSFADVDAGDTITYSAVLSDGSALPSWLTFNSATRSFSGNPSYSNAGTSTVRVTAADVAGASASDDFNLTVNLYPDLVVNGTTANDSLIGHSGNDLLDGLSGADTMAGARGNDTYVVDNAGDAVIELANQGIDFIQSSLTHALAENVENLTLTGTSAINGTGNTFNNMLTGNAANNILSGGSGTDTMLGGLGNDTYMVDKRRRHRYRVCERGHRRHPVEYHADCAGCQHRESYLDRKHGD